MKKILAVIILSIIFFAPQIVMAGDTLGSGLLNKSVGNVGLESSLETSVSNIITAVLAVVGTVFLVLTVVAGIMWMTAAGNDEKIEKAKKIIIGASIGLAVVLLAYTITYFVSSSIGGEAGSSSAGCCHTYNTAIGNDYNTMSQGVCQDKPDYQDWSAGACESD